MCMNRRPRPMCGCGSRPMPMPMHHGCGGGMGVMPLPGIMGGKVSNSPHVAVERVVEPTVCCAPNIIQHHRRIEHIVPVVEKNIHECHTHHDYIVKRELVEETVHHSHGECPPPVCATAPSCGSQGLFAR